MIKTSKLTRTLLLINIIFATSTRFLVESLDQGITFHENLEMTDEFQKSQKEAEPMQEKKDDDSDIAQDQVISSDAELKMRSRSQKSYKILMMSMQDDKPGKDPVISEDTKFYEFTKPEDYPYAVLLLLFPPVDRELPEKKKEELDSQGGSFERCSGTLVTLQWVLTAAFCFHHVPEAFEKVVIFAGGNSLDDYRKREYGTYGQKRVSFDFYPNERYPKFNGSGVYDLAAIKANSPFEKTKGVAPVPVSIEGWKNKNKYTKCKVTGFGKFQEVDINNDDYKRKTHTLEVISPCPYGCYDYEQIFSLGGHSVCAKQLHEGIPGPGLCDADTGAGLVCDGSLVAVASRNVYINSTEDCRPFMLRPNSCREDHALTPFQGLYALLRWVNKHTHLFDESKIKLPEINLKIPVESEPKPSKKRASTTTTQEPGGGLDDGGGGGGGGGGDHDKGGTGRCFGCLAVSFLFPLFLYCLRLNHFIF